VASGSYEAIAKKIFIGLEYDSERAGGFEPLRYLLVGKNVVLGVVSTKSPEMKDIDELVERVGNAAEVIARVQGRSKGDVVREVLGVSP
jgi:methionine synthase II (cobalamin-independent)